MHHGVGPCNIETNSSDVWKTRKTDGIRGGPTLSSRRDRTTRSSYVGNLGTDGKSRDDANKRKPKHNKYEVLTEMDECLSFRTRGIEGSRSVQQQQQQQRRFAPRLLRHRPADCQFTVCAFFQPTATNTRHRPRNVSRTRKKITGTLRLDRVLTSVYRTERYDVRAACTRIYV